jgi:Transposase IS4
MTWTSKYTCPGVMYDVPFSNECHTICCGLSTVLFVVELAEIKDNPPQKQPECSENLGKTGGLLLRLRKSLCKSAKVVELGSSFCVLKALVKH